MTHDPPVWTTPARKEPMLVWCEDCLHEVEPNHFCGPCAYCEEGP